MFCYPTREYAEEEKEEEGAMSNEPTLDLGRNEPESLFSGAREDGSSIVHPPEAVVLTTATSGGNGSLAFFHELGIDLQGKQVDDTLSLFPELKTDAKTSRTIMDEVAEAYYNIPVSSFGLDLLRSSKIPVLRHEGHDMNSHFARMLCEDDLQTALPKTMFQEHRLMMFGDCAQSGVEETFNVQPRDGNKVCTFPSQQLQFEGGNGVSFMGASSTSAAGEHFFSPPLSSCLPVPTYLEQNVRSFSPDLTLLDSEEVKPSPHPIRKLETVGGKKMFSSPYQSGSGYGAYKITDLGNSSVEYTACTCESTVFSTCTSTRSGNFREYLPPAPYSTCSLGLHVQNRVPGLQARTGSISHFSDTGDIIEDVELPHGYTLEHLPNKSASSYFGEMQLMDNPHMYELSLFDPVGTGSSTTRNQTIQVEKAPFPCSAYITGEQGSALKGFNDVLMAPYPKPADTGTQSPIYMEESMLARSAAFELQLLDNDGLLGSGTGGGVHVPITAKRSALTIHAMKPECTRPEDLSNLTNSRKEKRWIYKLARLPKKPQFSPVTPKKKRASLRSRRATEDGPKARSTRSINACGAGTDLELDGGLNTPLLASPSQGHIQFHIFADILSEDGSTDPLSTNDYLD